MKYPKQKSRMVGFWMFVLVSVGMISFALTQVFDDSLRDRIEARITVPLADPGRYSWHFEEVKDFTVRGLASSVEHMKSQGRLVPVALKFRFSDFECEKQKAAVALESALNQIQTTDVSGEVRSANQLVVLHRPLTDMRVCGFKSVAQMAKQFWQVISQVEENLKVSLSGGIIESARRFGNQSDALSLLTHFRETSEKSGLAFKYVGISDIGLRGNDFLAKLQGICVNCRTDRIKIEGLPFSY